jgi:signal recognition particle subunit SRP19
MTTAEPDTSKWPVIYPIYLDKSYSLAKGRRIAKDMALESPTAKEIEAAIKSLNIPTQLEATKRHPATPRQLGRIRFQLQDDAGSLWNEDADNKQTLLLLIANAISSARKEESAKQPAAKGGKKAGKK